MAWVAIDFETATEKRNSACALGVALVQDRKVVKHQSWLIRPPALAFNPYNVMIHGITEDDVASKPDFSVIWQEAQRFIGGYPLIAHNASFDMSVLRSCLDTYDLPYPTAPTLCTRMLAKSVWPGLVSYGLEYVAKHCGITFKHHVPEEDAVACARVSIMCCDALQATDLMAALSAVDIQFGRLAPGEYEPCRRNGLPPSGRNPTTPRKIVAQTDVFDDDHPLFGVTIAFTGTLMSMVRADAMQRVVNVGGHCATSVNRNVSFLVVGDQDFTQFAGGAASAKLRKAQDLRAEGGDIEIISEADFLGMLGS